MMALGILLGVTGAVLLLFGPYWWNYTLIGMYVSQIHFWAAELLVTILFLHVFVNFSTSAFKKRKDTWVVGALMLVLALITYAFGVGLNDTVVAQYNDKSAAGFWNSLLLGYWINPENLGAVLGWHAVVVPILLVVLLLLHFVLVERRGISLPHVKDVKYSMVKADHRKMFVRTGAILILAVGLGLTLGPLWANPFVPALTPQWASQHYPDLFASTIIQEFNGTSGTATYAKFSPIGYVNPYADPSDPVTYVNTTQVYVVEPYEKYVNLTGSKNELSELLNEPKSEMIAQVNEAYAYFENNGSVAGAMRSSNPMEVMAADLTRLAQQGMYGGILTSETYDHSGLDKTYDIRLLSDMGLIHYVEGIQYRINEKYMGMIKYNVEPWQVGAYWLAPYDLLEAWGDGIPGWHSLCNELIITALFLVLVFLPWVPGLRDVPDALHLYKLFWNRLTIPEMRSKEPLTESG
ncbi:MAG: cytochrome b N-terminal domain-containing protein [Thermoprotei archaeon]